MGATSRHKTYDRARILTQAERARRRGRAAKAVELYRRVLAVEPENADLHRKVAPLLVRRRQPEEAWRSYRFAAKTLAKRGFEAQATGLLREAAAQLPENREAWIALADLIRQQGRLVDAKAVLLAGRVHFRRRRHRRDAIELLARAESLDPDDLAVALDLARLLARCGNRARAIQILERLARLHPTRQRRIYFERFRVAPQLHALSDWLSALARRAPPRAVGWVPRTDM
jgi:tetratricopeptide (TPR) repeat protein